MKSCYHRDIKSANIVLKQDLTAQLIDCGLARFVIDKGDGPAQSVSSASARGTPGYICPEYAQGEVMVFDCGCDIYSFGVVLVELWTGKLQNHLDENGAVFNFTTQYIKMRKGKPRRDITSDADSTFGFAPSDVLPDCMIRFVELARVCMDDHNDIPDGRDVMNELLAIRRACVADDDYASLVGDGALVSQRLCDRCRSFYAMPDGTICRLCWDSEQQRRGIQEITSLLQAIGLQTNRAHERLDAIGIDANVVTTKVDSAATQTNSARLQPPIAAPLLDDMDANVAFAIPRLFFVVPTEKNDPALRPRKYLDGTTATKFHLYFVCAHTKRPIDAPIRIHMTQQWLQNAAPVLAVTLHLLRYGLSVLGPQEGLFLQVSEELVGDLLAEVRTMKKTSSGEHSGLLNRLDSTQPLDSTDVPELSADLYDHLLEVATEQRQWMQHMEPVRTGSNPATQWVSKDVADNESHGYIKVR